MTDMFSWRGQPIRDIHAWSAARGETVIRYRRTRTVPNIVTGRLTRERETGEMPEAFWDNLRFINGWRYERL